MLTLSGLRDDHTNAKREEVAIVQNLDKNYRV